MMNFLAAEKLSKIMVENRREEAKIHNMLVSNGIIKPSLIDRTGRQILSFVGRQMVTLGQRWESKAAASYSPASAQTPVP